MVWFFYQGMKEKIGMDDLIKICDELEKCKREKICYRNEIICTRSILKRYIGNDYNKLMKIKAELEVHKNFENSMWDNLSFIMSFTALVSTMIYNLNADARNGIEEYAYFCIFVLCILLAVIFIIRFYQKKTSSRSKWRKYIIVVIEYMEKEYERSNKDTK